jgi:mannose-1-phosphate guanylyltransferase
MDTTERKGDDVISLEKKPTRLQPFIAKGNFLWNSGMFCFKAGVLLEELKAFILKYMKIKIGLGK